MSLILDALHRSDQERNNENAVPGIQTRHGEPGAVYSPARWLLPGLLALLILSALTAWIFFGKTSSGEGVVPAQVLPDPAPALPGASPPSVTTDSPAVVSSAVTASPTVALESQKPVALERGPGIGEAPAPDPVLVVNSALDAPAREQVAELYQRRAAPAGADTMPAPGADKGQALPVEVIVAAVEKELVAPPLDENPVPLVQELPQATKDQIPSIFFSSHSWSREASEKAVTLNGEVRSEGDTVARGVRLIEILPESVVLDFQGTQFRLRALNSWVNL